MAKKLVLHIGMHSSGTTAIQRNLFRVRDMLLGYGVNYLGTEYNHSLRMFFAFCNRNAGADAAGGAPEEPPDDWNPARLRDELTEKLEKNTSPIFVISGERMGYLRRHEVEAMRDFLLPYFDEMDVICYVRPPRPWLSSTVQNQVIQGKTVERLIRDVPQANYRARVEKYMESFGVESVKLKLFRRSEFPKQCVVASFLDEIGVAPEAYEQMTITQENVTISENAYKLFAATNDGKSTGRSDLTDGLVLRLRYIIRQIGGKKFRLPDAVMDDLLRDQQSDIEWIERQLGCSIADDERGSTGVDAEFFWDFAHVDSVAVVRLLVDLLKQNRRLVL